MQNLALRNVNATETKPASHPGLTMLPTPEHLSLLFKHGRSTTLLSVLPAQPFSEIKETLLAALRSRNISAFPGTSDPLPEDANDLELGVLKDRKDATKGWVPLVSRGRTNTDTKASKKKASGKSTTLSEDPASAGLTDGSWLTYRLAPRLEDSDGDLNIDAEDPGWNVVLPSYDDEEGLSP